jgi:hypothetical protein
MPSGVPAVIGTPAAEQSHADGRERCGELADRAGLVAGRPGNQVLSQLG